MSLELKVSLTTNLEYILRASQSIQMTIESISGYFRDMSDWCAINLDEGTWYFSDLVTVSDKDSNEMVFAHKVTFDNEEDATAFKIKFGILDQMYVRN